MPEDYDKKVKASARFTESLQLAIPGFSGYKEKEMRREADKLLREKLAEKLKEFNERISVVYESIVESKKTTLYNNMNNMEALIDRLISKIEHGDYGYSGFFDAVKIQENALNAVYDHDASLFDKLGSVESAISKLESAVEEDEPDVNKAVSNLRTQLSAFEKKLDKRKDVLMTVG